MYYASTTPTDPMMAVRVCQDFFTSSSFHQLISLSLSLNEEIRGETERLRVMCTANSQ